MLILQNGCCILQYNPKNSEQITLMPCLLSKIWLKWSTKFPKGIELFVIQGGISSGSEFVSQKNPFDSVFHTWEMYVRVKPEKIIEAPHPLLIENPE